MSGTTDQRPWGPRPRPSAVGSARTQSPRWRYQSWAGIVAFMASQYQPNIMLGIGERISIGAFLLWVVVLAIALWRTPVDAADHSQKIPTAAPLA
jgi:hypothetical protein